MSLLTMITMATRSNGIMLRTKMALSTMYYSSMLQTKTLTSGPCLCHLTQCSETHSASYKSINELVSYRWIPGKRLFSSRVTSQISQSIPPADSTSVNVEGSLFKRVLKSLGMGKYRYSKSRLKRSGYLVLMCVDDQVDLPKIVKRLQLPDTFYSYYLITELHVWMLMCRLSEEGEDGRLVKQSMCSALWEDMQQKSKLIGSAASLSARKESIESMGNHFNAAMFAYDEGAVCDDKTLAGAVWRIIFHMEYVPPELLETVVAYIRKQMAHLEQQDSSLLLRKGIVTLLDLDADFMDQEQVKKIMSATSPK